MLHTFERPERASELVGAKVIDLLCFERFHVYECMYVYKSEIN